MEYRLPSGLPHINPNIEAIGPAFLNQQRTCSISERQKIMALLSSRFEPISDVASGDQKHMSGSHRKCIKQGESKSILDHDCARMTKRAVLFHRLIFL